MKAAVKLFISIIIALLTGFTGSLFTTPNIQSWYVYIQKSPYNPPAWVFAPVWTFLFILIGISLFLLWKSRSEHKKSAITFYFVQLILNLLWSVLFFGLHNPVAGFLDIILLWIFILICILKFKKVSPAASCLFIPYFLWVSFASYLNFMVIVLN